MKKLFQKSEIWFAVAWIIVYVLAFSNADAISESMGVPKLLTVPVGLALSLTALIFLQKNSLYADFGLCKPKKASRALLLYLPLIAISSVNFRNGVTVNASAWETVLYILSMCCVGFLEEVIFRGFLFGAMRKSGLTAAVIVSSLTFGMGHIVNLFTGAPVFETLLQLVYASAIGFCYTGIRLVSGSIVPCILSHIFVNSTSIFAIEPDSRGLLLTAVIQTVLGVGYGLWLFRAHRKTETD